MDYKALLALADQKQDALNKFGGRKMGAKPAGPSPAAIAAFKARKEREAQEKAARAAREREQLLALRAQNSKSLRRSKMMQNRTKDNDFSRINITEGEAKDSEKVEAKIRKSGIRGTKERMKERIKMDEKLAGLTRKDREKMIANMERDEPIKVITKKPTMGEVIAKARSASPTKPVAASQASVNRPKAPALSYDDLLSLANENSKTKTTLEEHIKSEMEAAKKRERPMTQKEKDRAREEEYYKSRAKQARLPTAGERQRAEALAQAKRRPPSPEPEEEPYEPMNVSSRKSELALLRASTSRQPPPRAQAPPSPPDRYSPPMVKPRPGSAANGALSRMNGSQGRPNGAINGSARGPGPQSSSNGYRPSGSAPVRAPTKPTSQRAPAPAPSSAARYDRERMPPPPDRQVPDRRPTSRDPPPYRPGPGPVRGNSAGPPASRGGPPGRPGPPGPPRARAYSPPPAPRPRQHLPPIGATYRRGMYNDYEPEIVEEEEYDDEEEDEMADFIDDDPESEGYTPETEYSKAIRDIFGYDKRKYRIEDDDDIEEASFSQCMKEESRSLRMGIQEDLEDIRREEEELKAKAARKKARRK